MGSLLSSYCVSGTVCHYTRLLYELLRTLGGDTIRGDRQRG